MTYNWKSKEWRDGWYARKHYDRKLLPLWILLGVFLKPLIQTTLWVFLNQ
jgi:hypothetical protein